MPALLNSTGAMQSNAGLHGFIDSAFHAEKGDEPPASGCTAAAGDRLKEATKINLSLSALGNVISALVDGKSGEQQQQRRLYRQHVAFLQQSTSTVDTLFGGNQR
jgi:hypothetical protein